MLNIYTIMDNYPIQYFDVMIICCIYLVGALILHLSNSVAKINIKKAIISNRASHAGDPVSIVVSHTFLVASRKAVAEHPLAVERSTVLCSSCPYHHVFTTSSVCWEPYQS